ncbi:MAG: DUF374 domain-containing protein [Bdellovibrionales bacterium]|nr:DUF374 domain-containing protein [Bdellovibrionales bacterium]
MKAAFRKHILPWLVLWIYRLFVWSWNTKLDEPPELKEALQNGEPLIFAFWHGHELAVAQLTKRYRLATMTSHSKDGELMTFVIHKLGGTTSRGSSSRGGAGGLKGLIRLVKTGRPASIAVDGPRGPIYEVKPGVFELSRLCKAKIFAVGLDAPTAWIFEKSWNKAILPKPFSTISVSYSIGMGPVTSDMDPKSAELASELKEHISDACQQARKLIDS